MVEKSRIWKGHVTVMCALQQSKFEVKNPYPYPLKPAPVSAGTGFRGYGYGLPWNTPGLPVLFPNDKEVDELGMAGYSDVKREFFDI